MQREVIKWLQSLDLSNAVQNPKRDLATGHAAAEILCRYTGTKYIDLQRLPSGAAAATKRDIWLQVYNALQKLHCASVTPQLIDAVLRREPNAALTVLECLYEHFTGHTLPMRGLDAVGTIHDAYVQPANAASTAQLLAATSGTGAARGKGLTSGTTLYDPLAKADTLASGSVAAAAAAALTGGSEKNRVVTSGADGTTVQGDTMSSSLAAAPALQQRLALIDNDELAGGANALQAYPRYARPTASTLVHNASGTRKDVVLDRPKYTADEVQQRAQNTRIAQQHAVVQRLQGAGEIKDENALAGNSQRGDGGGGGGGNGEAALSSSWPATSPTNASKDKKKQGATSGNAEAADFVPLTSVYRGKYYREPESTAKAGSTSHGKSTSGDAKQKKKRRGMHGSGNAASAASAEADSSFVLADGEMDDDVSGDGHGGAVATGVGAASHAAGDENAQSASQEKSGRIGSGGGNGSARNAVPKLRVKVHSTALKTALALRGGPGQLRDRAAALSRELFAKHHYALRPALSEILADVLSAHKQLEHLLDCASEDGSGEVLENVLGHLLAHRQAFPLSCLKACWETLHQHVDGIVATLQRTPDEYSYLLECFAFAFTKEAAQMPVLQQPLASGAGALTTTIIDGYAGDHRAARDRGNGNGANTLDGARGRGTKGSGSNSGGSEADHPAFSSQRSSLNNAATAATRRASEAAGNGTAAEDQTAPTAGAAPSSQHEPPQQQPSLLASPPTQLPPPPSLLYVNARHQLDLVSVFHLLSSIARQMEVSTGSYLLKRYVLRAATPFLLRNGTPAVREAVAQILSATFVTPAAAAMEGSQNAHPAANAATASSAAEAALVAFLTTDLTTCMQAPPHPSSARRLLSLSTHDSAVDGMMQAVGQLPPLTLAASKKKTRSDRGGAATAAGAVGRQRAYWHVFLHAVTDFAAAPEGSDDASSVVPSAHSTTIFAADGPLARCVHASAVACLHSGDVLVRTVGVRLVTACCARWWKRLGDEGSAASKEEEKDGDNEGGGGKNVDSTKTVSRRALRSLLSRVLVSLHDEAHPKADGEAAVASSLEIQEVMSAAWWNTRAAETWELRIAVLRLCTALLTLQADDTAVGAPIARSAANEDEDNAVDLFHAADVAAGLCLSTFAAAPTSAENSQPCPLWQVQLALSVSSTAVDATRAPSLTASWRQLLLSTATAYTGSTYSSGSGANIIIPSDGIPVTLLLSPLQLFGGVRAFLPTKPLALRPSSSTGATLSNQRTESLLSASRPLKGHADSRVAGAGTSVGRASVFSTRSQRNTAQTVLSDTAGSVASLPEQVPTALQLVCARTQSTYAVGPLYQRWNTRGVLNGVLSLPMEEQPSLRASASEASEAALVPPLLQLQLLTAGLAASALHHESGDESFWRAILQHTWPLLEAYKPSRDALASGSAHPPAALLLTHFDDSVREVVVAVIVVAVFLRCADETAVASAVAAAAEDWRALCGAALTWAETVMSRRGADDAGFEGGEGL